MLDRIGGEIDACESAAREEPRELVDDEPAAAAEIEHVDAPLETRGGDGAIVRPVALALSCRDFDEFDARRRFRNRIAGILQTLDVEFDRLLNEPDDLITRSTGSNAPGQIGSVGAEARFTLLNDDRVSHRDSSLLESRSLKYGTERSARHVGTRPPGDCQRIRR
jgi:hypothetical protein